MSKKKLQVEGITNELVGASLFFTQPAKILAPPTTRELEAKLEPTSPEKVSEIVINPTDSQEKQSDNQYNEQKGNNASKQASTISDKYDTVETIRKTVKQVGKEILFIRVTPEEKHELGSIVYSFNEIYRGEGRKTSENEVGRVALNLLLEDYRENGNNSILARVLAALNA
jgi:hypothetical protein